MNRSHSFFLRIFQVVLAGHFCLSAVFATTLNSIPVGELGQQANWIGRLQIESVSGIPSASKFPFSKVTATILEVFKGSGAVGEVVSFQIPGGTLNGQTTHVVGLPSFKPDGEYVLFLDSDPTASGSRLALTATAAPSGLTGWSAFQVKKSSNRQSDAKVVVRAGEPTLVEASSRGLALSHDRSIKSYDEFVTEIFRALD